MIFDFEKFITEYNDISSLVGGTTKLSWVDTGQEVVVFKEIPDGELYRKKPFIIGCPSDVTRQMNTFLIGYKTGVKNEYIEALIHDCQNEIFNGYILGNDTRTQIINKYQAMVAESEQW